MQIIIYCLVVFLSTMLGATTGVGGGAIIKPALDLIGMDTTVTISAYSCIAVFFMCITSLFRQSKNGSSSLDVRLVLTLSIGSILGGYLGEMIFSQVATHFENSQVKLVQSVLLIFVLIFVLIYTINKTKIRTIRVTNILLSFLVACLVGIISVFLGIGGGPLNIALLMMLYSYSAKEAAVYSLAMIFFAQLSKIVILGTHLKDYRLNAWLVLGIIIFAFIGGLVGTVINLKFSPKSIEKMYLGLICFLILICCVNIFNSL